jgi:AraC-like DNA-binding protein
MARLALNIAKTIKQIAADAGYADEGSFRRVFSRMTGMNPALYRRWVKDRTGIMHSRTGRYPRGIMGRPDSTVLPGLCCVNY